MKLDGLANQMAHVMVSAGYTASYDGFSDPLRFAGLVVIALQGVYWMFKLSDFIKGKGEDGKQNKNDNCSDGSSGDTNST